jgi:hypothetical protein
MPIIVIASDPMAPEKEIVEGTAERLGYHLLGPEVITDIASRNAVAPHLLTAALEKAPAAWQWKRTKRWRYYLACIEAEVLERLKADKTVCWGLAAHLYVQGVSHAFKVHLASDHEQRIKAIAQAKNISPQRAEKYLADINRRRQQWSQSGFGRGASIPSSYDMTLNMGQIDPDEAIQTIVAAAEYRKFKPMTYSIKSLADSALAARVKCKLLDSLSDVSVHAMDGKIVVTSKALKRERQKKIAAIKEIAGSVDGVEYVEVHLINYVIREAAESYR